MDHDAVRALWDIKRNWERYIFDLWENQIQVFVDNG